MRVDDHDREIPIKTILEESPPLDLSTRDMTRQDALESLKHLIDTYFGLPSVAMQTPVTHADMTNVLLLLYGILKNEIANDER